MVHFPASHVWWHRRVSVVFFGVHVDLTTSQLLVMDHRDITIDHRRFLSPGESDGGNEARHLSSKEGKPGSVWTWFKPMAIWKSEKLADPDKEAVPSWNLGALGFSMFDYWINQTEMPSSGKIRSPWFLWLDCASFFQPDLLNPAQSWFRKPDRIPWV